MRNFRANLEKPKRLIGSQKRSIQNDCTLQIFILWGQLNIFNNKYLLTLQCHSKIHSHQPNIQII